MRTAVDSESNAVDSESKSNRVSTLSLLEEAPSSHLRLVLELKTYMSCNIAAFSPEVICLMQSAG